MTLHFNLKLNIQTRPLDLLWQRKYDIYLEKKHDRTWLHAMWNLAPYALWNCNRGPAQACSAGEEYVSVATAICLHVLCIIKIQNYEA